MGMGGREANEGGEVKIKEREEEEAKGIDRVREQVQRECEFGGSVGVVDLAML